MSEIINGKLGLYGAEHSKCNDMLILGFKGLKRLVPCVCGGNEDMFAVTTQLRKLSLYKVDFRKPELMKTI